MKNDIILAGVGGQGILTIAAIIGKAAMEAGLNVKQSEVHGMSQRGGAVLAHLRLSSEPIFSDLIAEHSADVILAVEPMEALRHVEGLADDGAIISNANPVKNIADYPETEALLAEIKRHPKSVVLDADGIAAAGLLANIATDASIEDIISEYPRYCREEEYIKYPAHRETIAKRISTKVANVEYRDLFVTDGWRLELESGWFLIRFSDNDNSIGIKAEGTDRIYTAGLMEIAKEIVTPAIKESQ